MTIRTNAYSGIGKNTHFIIGKNAYMDDFMKINELDLEILGIWLVLQMLRGVVFLKDLFVGAYKPHRSILGMIIEK